MQDYRTGKLAVRGLNNTSWTSWLNVIDSSTIGSQSVNYATTAGTANAVTWANVSGKPTIATDQEGSRYTTDYNSLLTTGFYNGESTPTNAPNAY